MRKAEGQNEKYELIAGERRWQAAQNAGLHDVPVIVIEADNLKSLEFAIVENVQRKDLNPIERLMDIRGSLMISIMIKKKFQNLLVEVEAMWLMYKIIKFTR